MEKSYCKAGPCLVELARMSTSTIDAGMRKSSVEGIQLGSRPIGPEFRKAQFPKQQLGARIDWCETAALRWSKAFLRLDRLRLETDAVVEELDEAVACWGRSKVTGYWSPFSSGQLSFDSVQWALVQDPGVDPNGPVLADQNC